MTDRPSTPLLLAAYGAIYFIWGSTYLAIRFTVETLPIKIFNALRYGYTPTMASVTILFVATAAIIFSLVARFGDLPKLLGAMAADDK